MSKTKLDMNVKGKVVLAYGPIGVVLWSLTLGTCEGHISLTYSKPNSSKDFTIF